MKGPITVGFGSVLLGLAIILGPVFFIKRWSDDLWEERSISAKNLYRADQNAITNDISQRITHTKEIFKCAASTACSPSQLPIQPSFDGAGNASAASCPLYFNWIRQDLKPWAKTGITLDMVEAAKGKATFRLTIVDGRMYIETYRKSFQTRDKFTFWGIAQLLKFYPGMIPDLDLMFNCGDKPVIGRGGSNDPAKPPPALFHYCGSENTFDIVFPLVFLGMAGDNDTTMGAISEGDPDWQQKGQVGRQRSLGLLERQSLYRMETGTIEMQQQASLERSCLYSGLG